MFRIIIRDQGKCKGQAKVRSQKVRKGSSDLDSLEIRPDIINIQKCKTNSL